MTLELMSHEGDCFSKVWNRVFIGLSVTLRFSYIIRVIVKTICWNYGIMFMRRCSGNRGGGLVAMLAEQVVGAIEDVEVDR